MTTIREAANKQETAYREKYQDVWDDKQQWANDLVQRKLGVPCTLIDYEDENPTKLFLVVVGDKEFGDLYFKIEKFSIETQYIYYVYDIYRWQHATSKIRNSIELMRLLDG